MIGNGGLFWDEMRKMENCNKIKDKTAGLAVGAEGVRKTQKKSFDDLYICVHSKRVVFIVLVGLVILRAGWGIYK